MGDDHREGVGALHLADSGLMDREGHSEGGSTGEGGSTVRRGAQARRGKEKVEQAFTCERRSHGG